MVAVQSIILYFKIIFRQESNQAMPWLADLVESNEGSFNVLPVQCLCEFLLDSTNNLMESDEESSKDQKTKKRKQVRNIFTFFLKKNNNLKNKKIKKKNRQKHT